MKYASTVINILLNILICINAVLVIVVLLTWNSKPITKVTVPPPPRFKVMSSDYHSRFKVVSSDYHSTSTGRNLWTTVFADTYGTNDILVVDGVNGIAMMYIPPPINNPRKLNN